VRSTSGRGLGGARPRSTGHLRRNLTGEEYVNYTAYQQQEEGDIRGGKKGQLKKKALARDYGGASNERPRAS